MPKSKFPSYWRCKSCYSVDYVPAIDKAGNITCFMCHKKDKIVIKNKK